VTGAGDAGEEDWIVRVLEALLPSIVMLAVFIAVIVTIVRHSDGVRPRTKRSGGSAVEPDAGPELEEGRRDEGDRTF